MQKEMNIISETFTNRECNCYNTQQVNKYAEPSQNI